MTRLLQCWVTEQAQWRPEAPALRLKEERLSYGDLEQLSTGLARLLKDAGCHRGDRICLLLPKSPMAIVGILGILKADCIYVPLDISGPVPRVAHMLASSQPRCILAASASRSLLQKLLGEQILASSIPIGWMTLERPVANDLKIAFTAADCRALPSMAPDYRNTPADPAYILFTSGSTGIPKGVVITHANVTHFVDWATKYFGVGPDDRLSGHSPLHFDLSVFDIFGSFAAGGELHLVPEDLKLAAHKLAEFIRGSQLTQWFSVPSVLAYLANFNAVQPDDFPALQRVLWCGDVLPTPALRYWMSRLPKVSFTNLYGPTEATVASSYYTVPSCPDDDKAPIPIGTPCDGEELLVLDADQKAVPPGEVGDLYIRGVGLSPGYWQDGERTRAVFRPNPSGNDPTDRMYHTGDLAKLGDDGLVYFVGRADSQIKSRGYRIELGEIESALHALDLLRESAVVAIRTTGFEGASICCAYVPTGHADVTPVALRAALARVLPSYMLPSRWLPLDRLPINANGKTDRVALRELFSHS